MTWGWGSVKTYEITWNYHMTGGINIHSPTILGYLRCQGFDSERSMGQTCGRSFASRGRFLLPAMSLPSPRGMMLLVDLYVFVHVIHVEVSKVMGVPQIILKSDHFFCLSTYWNHLKPMVPWSWGIHHLKEPLCGKQHHPSRISGSMMNDMILLVFVVFVRTLWATDSGWWFQTWLDYLTP